LRIGAIETQLAYLTGPRTADSMEQAIADLEGYKAKLEAHQAKKGRPAAAND